MFQLLVLLIAFVTTCKSQVTGVGSCPEVQVVDDFQPEKYLGKWYEYARYPFIFEAFGDCVTAEYTSNSDGTIGVTNKQINSITKSAQTIRGNATMEGDSNIAKLIVSFPVPFVVKGTYWVLGTDYTSYAVVWSCNKVGFLNFQTSWILTRDRIPSKTTIALTQEIIQKNKIGSHYSLTKQDTCLEEEESKQQD